MPCSRTSTKLGLKKFFKSSKQAYKMGKKLTAEPFRKINSLNGHFQQMSNNVQ